MYCILKSILYICNNNHPTSGEPTPKRIPDHEEPPTMNPLSSNTLFGNWATLLLATNDRGQIDYSLQEAEIDQLIASRPNGIYSNGTACEFYTQTREEFVRLSQLLAEKCGKAGIPYQIGVSHPCAQESLERLRLIRELRPGAVQVILPDWFPVNDREGVRFLETMAETADGIPLVLYNPPHAKRQLTPADWARFKTHVPALIGVKTSDHDSSPAWYAEVRQHAAGLAVFVPGHHLATGLRYGAAGAYSNVACLNPFAAQRWYELAVADPEKGLEMEQRIRLFMSRCIDPFITEMHYPNHACDRFMALVGGWADVGARLRWPYDSIPVSYVEPVRRQGQTILPEFFNR